MNLRCFLHPIRSARTGMGRINAFLVRGLASPLIESPLFFYSPVKFELPALPRHLSWRIAWGWKPAELRTRSIERIVENPFIFRNLPSGKGLSILDVGCRESLMALELASMGHTVVGVDLNEYGHEHPNLRFFRGDLAQIPLENDSFDVAVAVSSIEHFGLIAYGNAELNVRGDVAAVQVIHRRLKVGGTLLLTVPYGQRVQMKWYRVYDRKALEELLEGFQRVRVEYYRLNADGQWVPNTEEEAAGSDSITGEITRAVACVIAEKPKP